MLNHLNEFVRIVPSNKIKLIAESQAKSLGELNNSITKGEGNYAGFLGENVVRDYLCAGKSRNRDIYNHDLSFNGFTIEVKSKRRTVTPELFYEVSIANLSRHQKPDYYVFTSIVLNAVYILGFISAVEFFNKAKYIKSGDTDPRNKFVCHCDMYNLEHRQLYPIRDFLNVLSITGPQPLLHSSFDSKVRRHY